MNIIYREVKRLDSIVNKLLFFTKPTNTVLNKSNINNFVGKILGFFSETHADNIKFVFKSEEGLPEVNIDADQLDQVLMNVIFNAVQSMPNGGEVVVGTRLSTEANMVCIDIADNGCGVSEQYLDKLFDPFFTTRAKGTGLGLTIAHEIILAHGGRIDIESKENKGTRVSIYLPI
ncbi:hypothetical protein N752_09620 [Desulforamulus aquiferis]|nr:ATP-binding protein [Desulforamulus aquiferis]RYD05595.1 hypothetical protein N752_09620 [Desulforamulus aquiferis]